MSGLLAPLPVAEASEEEIEHAVLEAMMIAREKQQVFQIATSKNALVSIYIYFFFQSKNIFTRYQFHQIYDIFANHGHCSI